MAELVFESSDKELNEKYDRLVKAYKDLPDIKKPMLNVSDVLRAYFILAEYFTDNTSVGGEIESMLVEVLHGDMLVSAISRQTAGYGKDRKYKEPLQICATLFYGIVKNHCFVDGNKRTALLSLLYQLDQYGYIPSSNVKRFENLTVSVAANELPQKYENEWKHSQNCDNEVDRRVDTIYRCLKKMTEKKTGSFHIDITAGEFIQALNKIDNCKCWTDKTKIKMERIVSKGWLSKKQTISYSISYGGWTRTIGAQTAREALRKLDLYEQYPDYKSLIDGKDPRYMLIERFEGPLRRLKDE